MRAVHAALLISGAMLCSGCGRGSTKYTEGGVPKAADGLPTQPPEASGENPYEALKGSWQVTAIEASGKSVAADRVQKIGLQYIFDGNKVTVHRPDRPDTTSTFTVDWTTNPKKMSINQTPVVRAAYAVSANKLQLCLMVDDNPSSGYPTKLASKASPKTDLLTLERR